MISVTMSSKFDDSNRIDKNKSTHQCKVYVEVGLKQLKNEQLNKTKIDN